MRGADNSSAAEASLLRPSQPARSPLWRRGRTIPRALAGMFVVGLAVQWWPGYVERTIAPSEIKPLAGHSYIVEPLGLNERWLFHAPFDSNDQPETSSLELLEDGTLQGPAHTAHARIVADGGGKYSHWSNNLYFSSSDLSDPRTNGRRYAVRAPLVPRSGVRGIIAIVLVVGAFVVLRALNMFITGSSVAAARATLTSTDLIVVAQLAAIAGLLLIAWIMYALLVDPAAGMSISRTIVIRVAQAGLLVAGGVAAGMAVTRRGVASLRWSLALIALIGTMALVYVRTEVYERSPSLYVPALLALATAVATIYVRRTRTLATWRSLWPESACRSHPVAIALVAVLVLAAPMIWSPVVEQWNTSGWMDSHGYDAYAHNILSGKHPEGHSNYMPVYQYGLAAVYYLFGHFFFASQLVNVGLAFLTVLFIGLAAWNVFRSVWAVLLVGVWSVLPRQLFYGVHFTQIETWYTPIVAFSLFAWSCYWRGPSTGHLLMVAAAAAIGINTRNQGAFYFGWLCLAPLFVTALPWRRRTAHCVLALVVLAASLVPWSLRNYAVEGRLSPSAARNAYYLALLNDQRIGFYGLRYWEGWAEIAADYERRYPDPVERDRAMTRAGLSTPFAHFEWFRQAVFWRALAFYGLVPAAILDPAGPRATDWRSEWSGYLYWRMTPVVLLSLSLIGLLTRLGATSVFLLGAVLAHVVVVALAGGAEDRVSYPVLPLHMLMALAAIFAPVPPSVGWSSLAVVSRWMTTRGWVVAGIAMASFLVMARIQFGAPNLYAPLLERAVLTEPDLTIDTSLPLLNDHVSTAISPEADAAWQGRLIRLRFIAMNYQFPPKWGGRIPGIPDFVTDPQRETYYYAALIVDRGGKPEHLAMAVAWFGAVVNEPLREGDEIEAEGRLHVAPGNTLAQYWVHLEKARKVRVRSTDIPAFF